MQHSEIYKQLVEATWHATCARNVCEAFGKLQMQQSYPAQKVTESASISELWV